MKMVQKTTTGERINHWAMMISFLVLFLTGFGFAFNSLNWLNTIFGGNAMASLFHKWGGLVFLATVLISLGNYFAESISYGPEDKAWLDSYGGYLNKNVELPPQGKMNFGQKLFYLIVVVGCGLLVSASGVALWLGPGAWSHVLHNLAFAFMAFAVPVHVYLATAANPGVFRVMTRGTVSLDFARKHYGKWVKEAGLE